MSPRNLPSLLLLGTWAWLWLLVGPYACAQPALPLADSVANPNYIERQLGYHVRYDFLDYEHNYLEWQDSSAATAFFTALQHADSHKVKVLHIGDSHVQADIYTGYVRNRLQEVFGRGGRGLVFPYTAARTHAAYDYRSFYAGKWTHARNIMAAPPHSLGIMGITVHTTDDKASFQLNFLDTCTIAQSTLLKIYCKKDTASFDALVDYGGMNPVRLASDTDAQLPYMQVQLPYAPTSLKVSFNKGIDSSKTFFECYGLSLEAPPDRGLLYHSVGINGADLASVLRQDLLNGHLAELQPNLVVLDVSGNDYYMGGLRSDDFENKLRTLIAQVRAASPKASILITCSQDLYHGYYNITDCGPAAALARRVALANNCIFYNYFRVAGGQYAMLSWLQQRLAKYDRVHLSNEGYVLKGELFSQAMLGSYSRWLRGAHTYVDTSYTRWAREAAKALPPKPQLPLKAVAYTTGAPAPAGYGQQFYTIRPGDVLGAIAQRYGVTVGQLQAWNGLAGTRIWPGRTLVIYQPLQEKKAAGVTAPTPAKQAPVKQPTTTAAKPGVAGQSPTYVVKKGDSLWEIARSYHTTVQALRQLNSLSKDALMPGQLLLVR